MKLKYENNERVRGQVSVITVSAGRPNKHLESVHTLLNDHSKIRNRISAKRRDNLNTSIETALKLIVYAEAGDKDGLVEIKDQNQ